MKKNTLLAFIACLSGILLYSCSKSDNSNPTPNNPTKATVSMYLTDGPADYDAIYLDVQSVEVTMSGSSAVVLTPIRPGIYDILRFRNGLDTLLLRTELPAGTISQIRLILGNNNSLVVNGVNHSLSTPSAQESGLKLNLKESFVAGGAYDIWLDFDAAKSILQTGNGQYKLKPVIRAYSATTNGRIKGYILPLSAYASVYAINGLDTFAAIPDPIDGFYRISGLPTGNYQFYVESGVPGFIPYILQNVAIAYGVETDLGTITLTP